MVSASTVSVVGGGVIGLAVAWRAARAGRRVTVHDPAAASGAPTAAAAWVAGGMLTPITEGAAAADAAGFRLGAASLRRWPAFAAELEQAAAMPSGLRPAGSLAVALTDDALAELGRFAARLSNLHRPCTLLTATQCRAAEPLLSAGVLGGLEVPGDLAVDNRALLAALREACLRRGVTMDPRLVNDLAELTADQVVIAAGAWSAALSPGAAVRPVKGEILRLRRRPWSPPPPVHTIRAAAPGGDVYLVPRDDGVVVGATVQDAGFDTAVTAGSVHRLITDAASIMPDLAGYELVEAGAGLRPMTPDGLPVLGRLDERTILATGHGRNGLLLTPITADLVLSQLAGRPLTGETVPAGMLAQVRPTRFSEMSVAAGIAP